MADRVSGAIAPLLLLALAAPVAAQSPLAVTPDRERSRHDALHYDAWIRLANAGDAFQAAVATRWRLTDDQPILIDLDGGYEIVTLTLNGAPARFTRAGDEISVALPGGATGDVVTRIEYRGAPPPFLGRQGEAGAGRATPQSDGLVQRGRGPTRKIFADNWPDRARKWLAAQDHPSDKATIAWTIEAPAALTVVANGAEAGVEPIDGDMRRWRFVMEQPIPVYTMVIGAARFAVTRLAPAACDRRCVPVSVLTYPADSGWAVNGPFRRAGEMIDYFSDLIAPFPYGELRHVQTSTIFGGMENATAIFYDERAFTGRTLSEGTVAHETAHQWFGDSATERDWHHLWLSEGFATYASALWNGHTGGESALRQTMAQNRTGVVASPDTERPIIDPDATDLMGLLNSNNYPKGAWVLHTLRGLVGDSAFFRGIRRYYRTFEHGTALSSDLAAIMSDEAGQDLTWYFEQALTQPGYPILRVDTRAQGGHVSVTIEQVQKAAWGTFRLPNLTIRVAGRTMVVPMTDRRASTVFHWEGADPPAIEVDPEGWWLLATEPAKP